MQDDYALTSLTRYAHKRRYQDKTVNSPRVATPARAPHPIHEPKTRSRYAPASGYGFRHGLPHHNRTPAVATAQYPASHVTTAAAKYHRNGPTLISMSPNRSAPPDL